MTPSHAFFTAHHIFISNLCGICREKSEKFSTGHFSLDISGETFFIFSIFKIEFFQHLQELTCSPFLL